MMGFDWPYERKWYEILGVGRDADTDECRRIGKALLSKYHPDHRIHLTPSDFAGAKDLEKELLILPEFVDLNNAYRKAKNGTEEHEALEIRLEKLDAKLERLWLFAERRNKEIQAAYDIAINPQRRLVDQYWETKEAEAARESEAAKQREQDANKIKFSWAHDEPWYEILGVSRYAERAEWQREYRRLALKYHPDRNPGDAAAEAMFKKIADAGAVALDDVLKVEFDIFWQNEGARRQQMQQMREEEPAIREGLNRPLEIDW